MVKRRRTSGSPSASPDYQVENNEPTRKRRFYGKSPLLDLPQELILRIFHFLPVQSLLTISRVSRKLHTLTSDSQLWKSKFWNKFIHPRIQRRAQQCLPSPDYVLGGTNSCSESDWRTWLDDHVLIQEERDLAASRPSRVSRGLRKKGLRHASETSINQPTAQALDWKGKFRLRSNWQRGTSRYREVNLLNLTPGLEINNTCDSKSKGPPIVGSFYEGYLFSADPYKGIRVFGHRNGLDIERAELACRSTLLGHPTCIAIEEALRDNLSHKSHKIRGIDFTVGYHNGSYAIYHFDTATFQLSEKYIKHGFDDHDRIEFASLHLPYLLTVTRLNKLAIFGFHSSVPEPNPRIELPLPHQPLLPPKLVTTLFVDSAWFPTCVSFRKHPVFNEIVAAVVFSVRSHIIGSSITVQEFHLATDSAEFLQTQIASPPLHDALDQAFFGVAAQLAFTAPTGVSYRYPFIMTSHADNTLVLYKMFTDDENKLQIKSGHRLWGHHTSVVAVEVGLTKAVSVDRRGEVRVWDLQSRYERGFGRDKSLKLAGSGDPLSLNLDGRLVFSRERCLVGFGEEEVVIMDRINNVTHTTTDFKLVVYDFT